MTAWIAAVPWGFHRTAWLVLISFGGKSATKKRKENLEEPFLLLSLVSRWQFGLHFPFLSRLLFQPSLEYSYMSVCFYLTCRWADSAGENAI